MITISPRLLKHSFNCAVVKYVFPYSCDSSTIVIFSHFEGFYATELPFLFWALVTWPQSVGIFFRLRHVQFPQICFLQKLVPAKDSHIALIHHNISITVECIWMLQSRASMDSYLIDSTCQNRNRYVYWNTTH